jgi:hypothetical protein
VALGHHRHAVLVRLTQYPNNLFVTESSLLHFRLSLQKRPFSQASTGPKFTGQVSPEALDFNPMVILFIQEPVSAQWSQHHF